MQPREKIINDFAEWAAFSSTRSGCPVKSRDEIYPLIRIPDYKKILDDDNIAEKSFNQWHRENIEKIINDKVGKRLSIGWAAKLINVYLKTTVYIAGEGRPNLVKFIHPPIDGILWKNIKSEYGDKLEIIEKTHVVTTIKGINKYTIYETIIDGCREIAKDRGCKLIEVDELWNPEGDKKI